MKTINVTFEDEEYEFLAKSKNGRSWREFILSDYISDKDIDKFKNKHTYNKK